MSNTFSFQRFGLLFQQHWGQNGRRYLMSLLALAGLSIGFFAVALLMGGPVFIPALQAIFYFIGLFITGALFNSSLFGALSSQTKGTSFLLLPASQLEKIVLSILFGLILFFIGYTLVFYATDWLMLKLADSIRLREWKVQHGTDAGFQSQHLFHFFKLEAYRQGKTSSNPFPYFHLGFIAMQAAYLTGSIYFGKYAFVKTTISLLVLGAFFTLLIGKLLPMMQPSEVGGQFPLQWRLLNDEIGQQWRYVEVPEWIADIFLFSLKFITAPVLWLAAYFRLKEKQI